MAKVVELQEYAVYAGGAAFQLKVQDREYWQNTMSFEQAVVRTEVLKIAGCTLKLEGSDDLDGTFVALEDTTSWVRSKYTLLSRSDDVASTTRLPRYLRWSIVGGGGAWEVCFRIVVTLS
jgi:hypothetical protein